jgi:hypothetical protein
VRPLLGRGFSPAEQLEGSGARVALVSDAFWQRRLAAAPDVLDRTLELDGRSYAVIGVMAAEFRYPYNADVWLHDARPGGGLAR